MLLSVGMGNVDWAFVDPGIKSAHAESIALLVLSRRAPAVEARAIDLSRGLS